MSRNGSDRGTDDDVHTDDEYSDPGSDAPQRSQATPRSARTSPRSARSRPSTRSPRHPRGEEGGEEGAGGQELSDVPLDDGEDAGAAAAAGGEGADGASKDGSHATKPSRLTIPSVASRLAESLPSEQPYRLRPRRSSTPHTAIAAGGSSLGQGHATDQRPGSGTGTGFYCGVAIAGEDAARVNLYCGIPGVDKLLLVLGFILLILGLGFGAADYDRPCEDGFAPLMLGVGIVMLLYLLFIFVGTCLEAAQLHRAVTLKEEAEVVRRWWWLTIILRCVVFVIVLALAAEATNRNNGTRLFAMCPVEWNNFKVMSVVTALWLALVLLRAIVAACMRCCPDRLPEPEARPPLSPDRIAHLRRIFERHDVDGNGVLDEDELYNALVEGGARADEDSRGSRKSELAQEKLRRAVVAVKEQMDQDADGVISFDEFCDAFEMMQDFAQQHSQSRAVKDTFGEGGVLMDASRIVDTVRYPAAMQKLGRTFAFSPDQTRVLRMIFDHFDADRSGTLSLSELVNVAEFLGSFGGADDTVAIPVGGSKRDLLIARAEQLKHIADVNHDGQLDFEEFCQCFGHMQQADAEAQQRLKSVTGSLFPAVFSLVTKQVLTMPTTGLENFDDLAERMAAEPAELERRLSRFSETHEAVQLDIRPDPPAETPADTPDEGAGGDEEEKFSGDDGEGYEGEGAAVEREDRANAPASDAAAVSDEEHGDEGRSVGEGSGHGAEAGHRSVEL